MSLITVAEPDPGKPQMHVLIIGVGRYTHLSGGEGPLHPDFRVLGQLNSPPVSARAMADWFLKPDPGFMPAATLSTIELLLSDRLDQTYERPDNRERQGIEPAIMANIERAFCDWDMRCSTNPDNIAFFYFCGHGLWKGMPVLLSENFAASRGNPWATAIDFDATYTGMGQCRAQTQYYVIDACRQWTDKVRNDLHVRPNTLKTASLNVEWTLRTAPQLYGAAIGRAAFGDGEGGNSDGSGSTRQVSRLTEALLKCLRGGGSDKKGGGWIVNTDCLGLAVHKLIEAHNLKRTKDERQNIIACLGEQGAGSRPLYRLPKGLVPRAFVSLGCLPPEAQPKAHFYFERGGEKSKAPEKGIWETELDAGVYNFGVSFDEPDFREMIISEEFVRPPIWPVTLDTTEILDAKSRN